MKKIISLVLAAVLTLSLAACGTKNDSKGDQPAAPASALDLLEKVWSTYTDDEKFPAAGGDYSEANSKEDAPGVYDLTAPLWTAPSACRRRPRWIRPRRWCT